MATPPGAAFLWEGLYVASMPNEGSTLTSMIDQSGSGVTAGQGVGASRGLWTYNAIAGYPGVRFDGVDDRYQFTGTALDIFRNAGGGTIVSVNIDEGPKTGESFDRPIIWFSRGTSSAARFIQVHTADPRRHHAAVRRLDADTSATGVPLDASAWSNVTDTQNSETALVDWSAGVIRHRVNNTRESSRTLPSSGLTSDTASQSAYIGSNAALTAFFRGVVTYIGLWPRVLTDAELASLHTDLAATYALTSAPLTRKARLIWKPPLSNGGQAIQDYRVERFRDGVWSLIAQPSVTTYVDTAALPGDQYRVAARNGMGVGGYTDALAYTVG